MQNQKKKQSKALPWVLVGLIIAVAVLIVSAILASEETVQPPAPATQPVTRPTAVQTPTAETEETTVASEPPENGIDLGDGLLIHDLGNYAGVYMEDGSNETVMNVMMLVLTNTNEADLQYAKIELVWGEQVCLFEATNLRAGSSAVLLEKNRQAFPGGEPDGFSLQNRAFFTDAMALHEDVLQISGMDGVLNVKNISDEDIAGDIYVYYKYSAPDIFYGGITFRARVSGGLKAGAIYQLPTGHYSPDTCTIVHVTISD